MTRFSQSLGSEAEEKFHPLLGAIVGSALQAIHIGSIHVDRVDATGCLRSSVDTDLHRPRDRPGANRAVVSRGRAMSLNNKRGEAIQLLDAACVVVDTRSHDGTIGSGQEIEF